MVRLLHTADVHLGRQFPSLRQKAGDYRSQLLRTFEKTADMAVSENVSVLLIAGDLFDSNRIFGVTIAKVIAVFQKLQQSGIRVCIVPGTHDAFTEESIYRSVHFPSNVTVFTPENDRYTYKDIELTVYGRVADSSSLGTNPLKGLSLESSSKYHVGMTHCSLKRPGIENEAPLLVPSEIAVSGLDYLALGHWHSYKDVSQGNTSACYSGSPEPIDMDQRGAGSAVMLTVDEKNGVEIEPVRVGTKRIDSFVIDVSPIESVDGIIKTILKHADPNLILEVTLSGLQRVDYSLNILTLEKELGNEFFNLRIIDQSQPKLDEIKLQDFPDKTVTGRFLRIMEEKVAVAGTPEDKAIYEEALTLGFALLQRHSQVIE
jgi:DNA repair protein SbcD/Mre11